MVGFGGCRRGAAQKMTFPMMKWIIGALSLITCEGCFAQPGQQPEGKSIEVGGMAIHWQYREDLLLIEASAPDNGWLALGFNTTDNIVGAYLIMAGVNEGKPYLEEHFVTGFGEHHPLSKLGGQETAVLIEATESAGLTRVRFSLPVSKKDKFRCDLPPGTALFMICAYSMSDDLQHHSRMRKHLRVVL